jgi:hypothetical protein
VGEPDGRGRGHQQQRYAAGAVRHERLLGEVRPFVLGSRGGWMQSAECTPAAPTNGKSASRIRRPERADLQLFAREIPEGFSVEERCQLLAAQAHREPRRVPDRLEAVPTQIDEPDGFMERRSPATLMDTLVSHRYGRS